jgi:hypothetical protein
VQRVRGPWSRRRTSCRAPAPPALTAARASSVSRGTPAAAADVRGYYGRGGDVPRAHAHGGGARRGCQETGGAHRRLENSGKRHRRRREPAGTGVNRRRRAAEPHLVRRRRPRPRGLPCAPPPGERHSCRAVGVVVAHPLTTHTNFTPNLLVIPLVSNTAPQRGRAVRSGRTAGAVLQQEDAADLGFGRIVA